MKCYNCGKDNPIIEEVLDCAIPRCHGEVLVPSRRDDETKTAFGVLCPVHQGIGDTLIELENKLELVKIYLEEWNQLITNRHG